MKLLEFLTFGPGASGVLSDRSGEAVRYELAVRAVACVFRTWRLPLEKHERAPAFALFAVFKVVVRPPGYACGIDALARELSLDAGDSLARGNPSPDEGVGESRVVYYSAVLGALDGAVDMLLFEGFSG